jgi:toxin HigB-1
VRPRLVSNTDIRYTLHLRTKHRGTADIYAGEATKAARATCPPALWDLARNKLDRLTTAPRLDDLRAPPGNRLEALRGKRRGQYSIRINERYRICFRWCETGATDLEIVDYH